MTRSPLAIVSRATGMRFTAAVVPGETSDDAVRWLIEERGIIAASFRRAGLALFVRVASSAGTGSYGLRPKPIAMEKRPFPPWWQERSRTRHGELAAAVDRLRAALPSCSGVRGALIFGSFARHETGPESDLDLIVVEDTDVPIVERGVALRRRLSPVLGIAFDLVVYTPDEYARLSTQSSFVRQAVENGIWIDANASG